MRDEIRDLISAFVEKYLICLEGNMLDVLDDDCTDLLEELLEHNFW
jgi:hypothetical protein